MSRCVRSSLQVIFWCALQASCLPTSGGIGIGPPDFLGRTPPTLLGLQIVQVYPGDPNLRIDPSAVDPTNPNAFIQIANESAKAVSFSQTPLSLLASGNVRMDLSNQPDLPAHSRMTVDVTALGLHWAAGELIMIDSQFEPQAYLAWGNTPVEGGPTSVTNLAANLPSLVVPVPFINATNLAIANDPNAQDPNLRNLGCVPRDKSRPQDAAAPAACPATDPTALLQLTEVAPLTTDFASWLEVLNISGGPVDLYGCRLCYQGACSMIDTSVVITTPQSAEDSTHSARAVLYLGSQTGTHTGANEMDLPNLAELVTSDEIVLTPPGVNAGTTNQAVRNSFITLGAVWSYVRYGDPAGSALPTLYLDQLPAGLWDSHTALAPRFAGESIALSPGANPIYSGWFPAKATAGLANVAYDPSNPLTWTSCSYAPDPEADAGIAISDVLLSGASGPLITLTNLSANAIDLTGWQLANPTAGVALPDGSIAAGGKLVVEVHADTSPCSDPTRLCWNNASLSANELTVLGLNGAVVHHLQWGNNPPDPNSRGDLAKKAHVWPGSNCQVAPPQTAGDHVSLSANRGHSPADYVFPASTP